MTDTTNSLNGITEEIISYAKIHKSGYGIESKLCRAFLDIIRQQAEQPGDAVEMDEETKIILWGIADTSITRPGILHERDIVDILEAWAEEGYILVKAKAAIAAMRDANDKNVADMPVSGTTAPSNTANLCPACGGNDADVPCAYPGKHEAQPGCLRNKRLECEVKQADTNVGQVKQEPELSSTLIGKLSELRRQLCIDGFHKDGNLILDAISALQQREISVKLDAFALEEARIAYLNCKPLEIINGEEVGGAEYSRRKMKVAVEAYLNALPKRESIAVSDIDTELAVVVYNADALDYNSHDDKCKGIARAVAEYIRDNTIKPHYVALTDAQLERLGAAAHNASISFHLDPALPHYTRHIGKEIADELITIEKERSNG